ncbi:hypothetical protein P152DRAFT_3029 [Eremomyces bilateralis CBS 781.70]|uniref:Uncharacterized protein n=1 Tax=Eremomyces bilateralis CBS 781.70 TaxID=1392243 RepID=A0A6G1GFV6_9PEZI|nr:uncharacterized protein P152DRAFT_3029 [Eremomyces bilateralis CBS 781.70]KAF1816872.1 hypothetical protein P152DRAFT_3029 [Eremomyces bilateralis CBS 781.70]
MSNPRTNPSAGVKSLRAMFENADPSPSSPAAEPRGRSPAASSVTSDRSSRPISKVRTSFVSVQPSGQQVRTPSASNMESSLSRRRESFSADGQEVKEEVKKVVSGELRTSVGSAGIQEAIPEQPLETPGEGEEKVFGGRVEGKALVGELSEKLQGFHISGKKEEKPKAAVEDEMADKPEDPKKENLASGSAAPSPSKELTPLSDTTNTGKSMVPESPLQENPVQKSIVQVPAVHEQRVQEPTVQQQMVKEPTVQERTVQEPKGQDAIPTDISQSEPVEASKPATNGTPEPTDAPKTPVSKKTNGTPSTKPVAKPQESKRQPRVEPKPVAKPLVKPNGQAKGPMSKASATASVHPPAPTKSITKPSKPSASTSTPNPTKPTSTSGPSNPIQPPRSPAPKSSRASLRASTTSTSTTSTLHPPSTGFVKPRPKSPTRPITLPAHLVAPTTSSSAKLRDSTASATTTATSKPLSRKPSTLTRDRVAALPKQQPHSSFGPAPRRVSSRASLGGASTAGSVSGDRHTKTAPDEGFLARMMRPTQSSSSKAREELGGASAGAGAGGRRGGRAGASGREGKVNGVKGVGARKPVESAEGQSVVEETVGEVPESAVGDVSMESGVTTDEVPVEEVEEVLVAPSAQ